MVKLGRVRVRNTSKRLTLLLFVGFRFVDIGKNRRTQQKLFIISYTVLLLALEISELRHPTPLQFLHSTQHKYSVYFSRRFTVDCICYL
jgi:hypothetical protein